MKGRESLSAIAFWMGRLRRQGRRFLQLVATHGWRHAVSRLRHKLGGRRLAGSVRLLEPLPLVRVSDGSGRVDFQPVVDPDISIIIPCRSQTGLTLNCLSAIREQSGDLPYEVIVVDDASPEPVERLLGDRVSGIRFLRQEENRGFGESCNAGARAARGPFLVFLNNDTEVQPGWLAALRDTFTRHERVGLVGVRLVYPDGSLQEAGGCVFADGSAANRGRGGDPEAPPYRFVRAVDYCSAACIMVPQALFAAVGGFEPAYGPAYYEDTDLAFKIRRAGYRVLYQPHALVVHLEGATAGRNVRDPVGLKRYQETNREIFWKRWTDELAQRPRGRNGRGGDARDHAPPRVLFVQPTMITPDRDSGSLRAFRILQLLVKEGCTVVFCPRNLQALSPYREALEREGVEYWRAPYVESVEDYLHRNGADLDLVFLSSFEVAHALLSRVRRSCPRARVVYDTVDLHHVRFERQAALEASAASQRYALEVRRREIGLSRKADAVIVVSERERALLVEGGVDRPVHVLSNIQDPCPGRGWDPLRREILFIGSFRHPPNVDAGLFLIREIWPRLRIELPEAHLVVVGQDPPRALLETDDPTLEVLGHVPDLGEVLERTRIMVAPLRVGAGVKGKVNQALACGIPVVGSPIAFEGMPIVPGRTALVAESREDFVREIVRLYRDRILWETLREGGLDLAREHYTMEAARVRLRNLLDTLGFGSRAPAVGEGG